MHTWFIYSRFRNWTPSMVCKLPWPDCNLHIVIESTCLRYNKTESNLCSNRNCFNFSESDQHKILWITLLQNLVHIFFRNIESKMAGGSNRKKIKKTISKRTCTRGYNERK